MRPFEGAGVFMGRLPSCAAPFGQSMSTLALSSPVGAWAGLAVEAGGAAAFVRWPITGEREGHALPVSTTAFTNEPHPLPRTRLVIPAGWA